MTDPLPTDPEGWPHRWTERLRYGDTDRQGHVNNAVYATLFESSRVAFLFDPEAPVAPAGAQFVLARIAIDFRREMLWPGTVEIAAAVTRIGRSSVALRQALWREGVLSAEAESVVVLMDDATRAAVPLPEETRAALAPFALRGA